MRNRKFFINTLVRSLLILTFGFGLSLWIFKFYKLESESQFGPPVLAYVRSISVEETPVKGEFSIISVNGSHANYCGRIDHHEQDIQNQNKLVNITLWASYYKGLCLQAVKPFTYRVWIIFPSSGIWTIICNRVAINITVLD